MPVKDSTPDVLDAEEEQAPTVALARRPTLPAHRAPADVVLTPVMDVRAARQRMAELQEFCASYLQESADGGTDGGDYGLIPGAGKKKVLLKSGAEKLCDVYGLADRYQVLDKVEDFDRGLFDYTIECILVRKTDEMFVGSGLGSCSSYEAKYRWREGKRKCPTCGSEAIIKGKAEYGGGWLCWKKKDGCGAQFSDDDAAITSQNVGRVENPDIFDSKNTVLKIAKKRAKIDAVIGVTRSSGIFTQDVEEMVSADHAPPSEPPRATKPATKRTAAPRQTTDTPTEKRVSGWKEVVVTAVSDKVEGKQPGRITMRAMDGGKVREMGCFSRTILGQAVQAKVNKEPVEIQFSDDGKFQTVVGLRQLSLSDPEPDQHQDDTSASDELFPGEPNSDIEPVWES